MDSKLDVFWCVDPLDAWTLGLAPNPMGSLQLALILYADPPRVYVFGMAHQSTDDGAGPSVLPGDD